MSCFERMTAQNAYKFRVSLEVSGLKGILDEEFHAVLNGRVHLALAFRVRGVESSASTGCVSADHLVLLEDDYCRAVLEGFCCRRETCYASSDDNHISRHLYRSILLGRISYRAGLED